MVNVWWYFYFQGTKYPAYSQQAGWEFDELEATGGHMHHMGHLAGPTSKKSTHQSLQNLKEKKINQVIFLK